MCSSAVSLNRPVFCLPGIPSFTTGTTQSRRRSLRPPSPASPACDPRRRRRLRLLSHISSDFLRLLHLQPEELQETRPQASTKPPAPQAAAAAADSTVPAELQTRSDRAGLRSVTLCIRFETQAVVSEGDRDRNKPAGSASACCRFCGRSQTSGLNRLRRLGRSGAWEDFTARDVVLDRV